MHRPSMIPMTLPLPSSFRRPISKRLPFFSSWMHERKAIPEDQPQGPSEDELHLEQHRRKVEHDEECSIYAPNIRLEYTPPLELPSPFPRIFWSQGECSRLAFLLSRSFFLLACTVHVISLPFTCRSSATSVILSTSRKPAVLTAVLQDYHCTSPPPSFSGILFVLCILRLE
jgi:hypothetical protein